MAASKDLLNTITRNQVYLERLKVSTANDIKATLDELGPRIKEITDAIEAPTLDKLTKAELKKLVSDMQNVQGELLAKSLDQLMGELEPIAEYTAEFEGKVLASHTQGVRVETVSGADTLKAALADPIYATGEKLDSFTKGWTAYEKQAVSDLVAKGFAEGWTNQQLFQAVRGTKANKYKDGLVARVGRNAEAVVHTAVQQVASAARMATMDANADILDGYRIIATLDGKTMPLCRSLDQKVFELHKGPVTPLHIRCRSSMVPEVGEEWAFLDKGATRSAMDGPVSSDTSYYEWLKGQPVTFQESVLGPTRTKLFRDGGLSPERFAQLNLGRNFEPLTLKEMRKLEPLAFEKADI